MNALSSTRALPTVISSATHRFSERTRGIWLFTSNLLARPEASASVVMTAKGWGSSVDDWDGKVMNKTD
jgi:hypothetical protein